jgi:hypothetical protein
MNSKKLGQRKNCNLPGVLVDLPVLGPKDVDDVQNFAAKHGMDFVAASFVQSADDVRWAGEGAADLGTTYVRLAVFELDAVPEAVESESCGVCMHALAVSLTPLINHVDDVLQMLRMELLACCCQLCLFVLQA